MKTEITVYEIPLDERSTPDNQMGGNMEFFATAKTWKSAIAIAKKESMNEKTTDGRPLHEMWVEKKDADGDIIEQMAFAKGKPTYQISL